MNRAVITGAGVVSAFGVGLQALFDGLAQGRSAVGFIRNFDAATFPTRVAGEVPVVDTNAAWVIESLRARLGMTVSDSHIEQLNSWDRAGVLRDRKVSFALLAAAEAWAQAGLAGRDDAGSDHARDARAAWLAFALGLERAFLIDFLPIHAGGQVNWQQNAIAPLPAVRFRAPLDLGAQAVRSWLDLAGPCVVHASACAAGALAMAHAAALIERGRADIVVCGASDSMINPFGMGGMARIGAPSLRNEPDACRPFDRRRDGMAMGEGAAVFVVEAENRARARGASILAQVVGWGSTQDAYKATAPRPDGAAARVAMARAVQRANARTGMRARDIGYINAHGTGTVLNDPAEARAIRAALGEHGARVPVSSIKGALGHLMAASGAIELAVCLLPFARDLLPGTAHHRERDPECAIHVIGEAPVAARVEYVLSNSFGFGGQNATVILRRPQ